MKKLPVLGFHTGCSRPSAGPAPGMLMWPWAIETGEVPLVVLKRGPNAGASALFAARTCWVSGEYAISSTRKTPPVGMGAWSTVGAAGLVVLKILSVLLPSPA